MPRALNQDCIDAIVEACWHQQQTDPIVFSINTLFNLLTINRATFFTVVRFLYQDPQSLVSHNDYMKSRLEYLLGINSGYIFAVYKDEALSPPWPNPVQLPTTINYFEWTRRLSFQPFLRPWKPRLPMVLTPKSMTPRSTTPTSSLSISSSFVINSTGSGHDGDSVHSEELEDEQEKAREQQLHQQQQQQQRQQQQDDEQENLDDRAFTTTNFESLQKYHHARCHGSKCVMLWMSPAMACDLLPFISGFENLISINFTAWKKIYSIKETIWMERFVTLHLETFPGRLGAVHLAHEVFNWGLFVRLQNLMGKNIKELLLGTTRVRLSDLGSDVVKNVKRIDLTVEERDIGDGVIVDDDADSDDLDDANVMVHHSSSEGQGIVRMSKLQNLLKECRTLEELILWQCVEPAFRWARLEYEAHQQFLKSSTLTINVTTPPPPTTTVPTSPSTSPSLPPLVPLKRLRLEGQSRYAADAVAGFRDTLEYLYLDHDPMSHHSEAPLTDFGNSIELPKLTTLKVKWQYFELGGLIRSCPNLTILDLRGLDDAVLTVPIKALPPLLQELRLYDPGYSLMDWEVLQPLQFLTELELSENKSNTSRFVRATEGGRGSIYKIVGRPRPHQCSSDDEKVNNGMEEFGGGSYDEVGGGIDWYFPRLKSCTLEGTWAIRLGGQILQVAPVLQSFRLMAGSFGWILNAESFLSIDSSGSQSSLSSTATTSRSTAAALVNFRSYPALTELMIKDFTIDQLGETEKKDINNNNPATTFRPEFWQFFKDVEGEKGLFPNLKDLTLTEVDYIGDENLILETAMRYPSLSTLLTVGGLDMDYITANFEEITSEEGAVSQFIPPASKEHGCVLECSNRRFCLKESAK